MGTDSGNLKTRQDAPAPPKAMHRADAPDLRRRETALRRERTSPHRVWRMVAALALAFSALALWLFARCAANGLPEACTRRLEQALSGPDFSVSIAGLSLDVPSLRLRAGNVRLWHRGSPGDALLAAHGLELRLKPHSALPGPEWIESAKVESVTVAIDALLDAFPETGEEPGPTQALPDLAPIRLACRQLDFGALRAREITGYLSCHGGRIALEEASAAFHDRSENAQVMHGRLSIAPDPLAIEASGTGRLDCAKLSPLLRQLDVPGLAAELERFTFPIACPLLEAGYRYDPGAGIRRLRIGVSAGASRYAGVPLTGFSGIVAVTGNGVWNTVDIRNLDVRRPEGSASGQLQIDVDAAVMRFDATSSIDPVRLAAMLGLCPADARHSLSIEPPIAIHAEGTVGLWENPEARTDIALHAQAGAVAVRGFKFTHPEIEGRHRGGTLTLPRVEAGAMGGSLRANATLTPPDISLSLELSDVPQARWAEFTGNEADADAGGMLDMKATFEGPMSELGRDIPATGTGTVLANVRGAKIFRIPLFAGLTDLLGEHVPGIDFLVEQTDAEMQASFTDGRMFVRKFSASGAAFGIDGSGSVRADGSELDAVMQLRLLNERSWIGRKVGLLLSPFWRIFALRAFGSLQEPHWSIAPFSRPAKH